MMTKSKIFFLYLVVDHLMSNIYKDQVFSGNWDQRTYGRLLPAMQVIRPNSAINPAPSKYSCSQIAASDKYVFYLPERHHPYPSSDKCSCVLYVFNVLSRMWKQIRVEDGQPKPCAGASFMRCCNDYLLLYHRPWSSKMNQKGRLLLLPLTIKPTTRPFIELTLTNDIDETNHSYGFDMLPCPQTPNKFVLLTFSSFNPDQSFDSDLSFDAISSLEADGTYTMYSLFVDPKEQTATWETTDTFDSSLVNWRGSNCLAWYNDKIITIEQNERSERAGDPPGRYMLWRDVAVDGKESTTGVTVPDSNHGYPRSRISHAQVQHLNMVYIIGGEDVNRFEHINDVWQLNVDTKQWTKMPFTLHKPLSDFSAAIAPAGRLWVIDGKTYDGPMLEEGRSRRSISNEDLACVWLSPPPLRQLALQQLQQLQPNLTQHSASHLAAYGIPKDIIQDLKDKDSQFLQSTNEDESHQ